MSDPPSGCPAAAQTFSREQFDLTFDPSKLQLHPEQQLIGRSQSRREQLIGQSVTCQQKQEIQPGCLKRFVFCPENVPSLPVRDSGLISPPPTKPAAAASPLLPSVKHSGAIKDNSENSTFESFLHWFVVSAMKQKHGEKFSLPGREGSSQEPHLRRNQLQPAGCSGLTPTSKI